MLYKRLYYCYVYDIVSWFCSLFAQFWKRSCLKKKRVSNFPLTGGKSMAILRTKFFMIEK